jgi:NADH:ubiquinone oxidoreductase subunit F (NADH-binding)
MRSGRLAATRAAAESTQLPRLLPDTEHETPSLARHLDRHAEIPNLSSEELIDEVELAGLTGRGGAAFPVYRKLRAVREQPGSAVVIGNGCEGEPAAAKDWTLIRLAPHLVLDGLEIVTAAVGATRVVLYLHEDERLVHTVTEAIGERMAAGHASIRVEVMTVARHFIAGEESAVVRAVEGGRSIPRAKPPRVFESGVHGRPTLVQNVESLAHLALIARYGGAWFRALGTAAEPGSMLFTITGAVRKPRVVEAPIGVAIDELWRIAGGLTEPIQAVLLGGYHGAWLSAADAESRALCNAELRPLGTALGAGVVVALPASVCGLVEAARVLRYLAGESAGQCGPCLHGLPRLAGSMTSLATPRRLRGHPTDDIDALATLLRGRNACHHPDGSIRFAESGLRVFADEASLHRRGGCSAASHHKVLPTPGH